MKLSQRDSFKNKGSRKPHWQYPYKEYANHNPGSGTNSQREIYKQKQFSLHFYQVLLTDPFPKYKFIQLKESEHTKLLDETDFLWTMILLVGAKKRKQESPVVA